MSDDDLIVRLRRAIAEHYVFPDRGATIADRLRPVEVPDEQLPAALTAQLWGSSRDSHLRVRRRPRRDLDADSDVDLADVHRARYCEEARMNAGGVQSVRRLSPDVGLLSIAPYLSPVELAHPYLDAAFALLGGVSRLVIDVRDGRGGTPETVAYLCGYLLGEEPVHLQDVVDRSGHAQQFWSSPRANRLSDDTRIDILTSAETFSGCEELAYNLQVLGRARVVGETTAGGAHPVEVFALPGDLEVAVPVARSRNAVTGTNWEGSGVIPDLSCTAAPALDRALED